MNVQASEEQGVKVLQVSGEINISTSPDLKKLFDKEESNKVVIDFEEVVYVDSSGLATLVEMLKRIKGRGGALGLANMPSKIKSLFEITKLDKLFSIYADRNEAVTKIK